MTETLHASTVAFGAVGVLILGPAGAGKSTLAAELVNAGGTLVADDKTIVEVVDGELIARCPPTIQGQLELRYVGIVAVPSQTQCVVRLVVDLSQVEPDRLPPHRQITLSGIAVDCIFGKNTFSLSTSIKLLLTGGRIA